MAREKILPLARAHGSKLIGGKAVALARLINAGFKVPEGFVVLSLENEDDVLAEFDKLDARKAAVRSSAAAEDGAKDAWAGQFDTFLNITRNELIDKISSCFDSVNSERAKAYAKDKKIQAGKVAVIVQKMVPAKISGVAFSANPVSKDLDQIVIEAVKGLGEKLVSGTASPDTYVVNKKSAKIIQEHLAGNRPKLQAQQLEEIVQTVGKIERLFGFPIDVEWAYAGGQLFILQSRPITTLG